jgi:putative transcriptional regulator
MKEVVIGKCLLPTLLKQSHKSPIELSELTGISIQQLSKYINNKTVMSLPTSMVIADVLKCHIDELYDYRVK